MRTALQTGPLVCERRFSPLSLAPPRPGSQRPSAALFLADRRARARAARPAVLLEARLVADGLRVHAAHEAQPQPPRGTRRSGSRKGDRSCGERLAVLLAGSAHAAVAISSRQCPSDSSRKPSCLFSPLPWPLSSPRSRPTGAGRTPPTRPRRPRPSASGARTAATRATRSTRRSRQIDTTNVATAEARLDVPHQRRTGGRSLADPVQPDRGRRRAVRDQRRPEGVRARRRDAAASCGASTRSPPGPRPMRSGSTAASSYWRRGRGPPRAVQRGPVPVRARRSDRQAERRASATTAASTCATGSGASRRHSSKGCSCCRRPRAPCTATC